MATTTPLVSIISPFYNEREVLPRFFARIVAAIAPLSRRYQFELVLVDDGSRDGSLATAKELLAQEPRLRIIELRRNYGQTIALQAGFDAARGDILITLDSDLQHFPEEIPLFLEKIEAGFDVVCGWRHDRQEGLIRRWPSRVANRILRKISKLTIHDIGTTYRAYRTEVVRDLNLMGDNHRFIPVFAKVAGAKIEEIKIQNVERPVGASNYGISRTFDVFLDLFFLYFYTRYFDRPIRIFGKIAFSCLFLGGLIIFVLLLLSFQTGMATIRGHSGWFGLSSLLIASGIQFLLTGLLAEVVARIYYASDRHPLYRIRSEWAEPKQ